MKTLEQFIDELFKPLIDETEELSTILNDKNVQEMVEMAHSYVDKDEMGVAEFIAELLNEHYRTDKFTDLCLKS